MKEIKLTKGKVSLVDDEDYEFLSQYKWSVDGAGRANSKMSSHKTEVRGIRNKVKQMHRVIMNCPDDMFIDHINMNPLDNRKSNLRICTRSQNGANRNVLPNSKSGVKGVCFHKHTKKWVAFVKSNGKAVHFSYHKTIEEAIDARRIAALKFQGEFARETIINN